MKTKQVVILPAVAVVVSVVLSVCVCLLIIGDGDEVTGDTAATTTTLAGTTSSATTMSTTSSTEAPTTTVTTTVTTTATVPMTAYPTPPPTAAPTTTTTPPTTTTTWPPCRFCDGRGRRERESNCLTCYGNGKLWVEETIVCDVCEGDGLCRGWCALCKNGWEESKEPHACWYCEGLGKYVLSGEYVLCDECDGKGTYKVEEICRNCSGSGLDW